MLCMWVCMYNLLFPIFLLYISSMLTPYFFSLSLFFSFSLSPSFSRSPVSLFLSRRQSAFYSRGLSLLRALSLLSRGRATGCTLRLPASSYPPRHSLSVSLSLARSSAISHSLALSLSLSCARARAVLKVLSFGVVLTSKPSDFAHTLPSCPAIAALVTHLDASNCLST